MGVRERQTCMEITNVTKRKEKKKKKKKKSPKKKKNNPRSDRDVDEVCMEPALKEEVMVEVVHSTSPEL